MVGRVRVRVHTGTKQFLNNPFKRHSLRNIHKIEIDAIRYIHQCLLKLGFLEGDEEGWAERLGDSDGKLEGRVDD